MEISSLIVTQQFYQVIDNKAELTAAVGGGSLVDGSAGHLDTTSKYSPIIIYQRSGSGHVPVITSNFLLETTVL